MYRAPRLNGDFWKRFQNTPSLCSNWNGQTQRCIKPGSGQCSPYNTALLIRWMFSLHVNSPRWHTGARDVWTQGACPCTYNWSPSAASKHKEVDDKPSWEEENTRVSLVLDLSLIACSIVSCWCSQEIIFRLCSLGNKIRRKCPQIEKGLKVIWSLCSPAREERRKYQHKKEWGSGSLTAPGKLWKGVVCTRKGGSLWFQGKINEVDIWHSVVSGSASANMLSQAYTPNV